MFCFYTPENVKKSDIFGRFQGVHKLHIGVKWDNTFFVSSQQDWAIPEKIQTGRLRIWNFHGY